MIVEGLPGVATPLSRHPLTARTVLGLQDMRAYPSVSLLVNTRPGPGLDAQAYARLAELVSEARTRLRAEPAEHAASVTIVDDVLAALLSSLEHGGGRAAVLDGPVERALAVFVSPVHTSRMDLPVEVVERSVVDPTFATRDLVRALHRTPRHVVLLLGHDEAHLFDGRGDDLTPVRARFPLHDAQHQPGEPARLRFLRTVDDALGAYLRLHPAPLIIAGPQPTLSSFRWASRHTARLAGELVTPDGPADPAELRPRIRSALEQYLLSRHAEALDLLARRRSDRRAVLGVQDAWLAARRLDPEMLAVEQGYFYPARLTDATNANPEAEPPRGDGLGDIAVPATDVHAPDVIDDLVDELIETVIARGGWVALLPDGSLPADVGVALTLRRRH